MHKRNKPQANALILNDLDKELSDDTLNELAAEDALHEEFWLLISLDHLVVDPVGEFFSN